MQEPRIFGRFLVVKTGKKLSPRERADYEDIARQVGDSRGEWIAISRLGKPEGTRALRRNTSEITDYLFVKHPREDEAQTIEGFYISTVRDEDEIIRYEVIRFPAWYQNEIYSA